jgi:dTDP-4-dehydrorhamnose reductase
MIDSAFTPLSSLSTSAGPVVVLGSSGLIGQALLQALARRRVPALGFSRRKREGIDLARVDSLAPILTPLAPRLVINAASLSDPAVCAADPGAAYAINTRLPALLARCGLERGLRWVQVSGDAFFAGPANVLQDEHASVQLLNEAARTRYAGEALARTDPACLVLRTHVVGWRGPSNEPGWIERTLAALEQGRGLQVYRDQWASRLDSEAFADALLDLVDAGARGLLHVGARESVSQAQFVHALAVACQLEAEPARVLNTPVAERSCMANATGLNVSRAEHWLGRRLADTAEVVQALASARSRALGAAHEGEMDGKVAGKLTGEGLGRVAAGLAPLHDLA